MRLERAFSVAFDASANPMGVSDDDRVYRVVNPAACSLLGYGADELVGRRIESFYDDAADRAQIVDGWERFLAEGTAAPSCSTRGRSSSPTGRRAQR